jgi:hypothetical protein
MARSLDDVERDSWCEAQCAELLLDLEDLDLWGESPEEAPEYAITRETPFDHEAP